MACRVNVTEWRLHMLRCKDRGSHMSAHETRASVCNVKTLKAHARQNTSRTRAELLLRRRAQPTKQLTTATSKMTTNRNNEPTKRSPIKRILTKTQSLLKLQKTYKGPCHLLLIDPAIRLKIYAFILPDYDQYPPPLQCFSEPAEASAPKPASRTWPTWTGSVRNGARDSRGLRSRCRR